MKNKAAIGGIVLAIVFGLLGCLDTGTRHNPGGFGSFVAGTEVWTRSGLVAIDASSINFRYSAAVAAVSSIGSSFSGC